MGGSQSNEDYNDSDRVAVNDPTTGNRIFERDYNTHISARNVASAQALQNQKHESEMRAIRDIVQVAVSSKPRLQNGGEKKQLSG